MAGLWLWILLCGPALGQTWFPPSSSWLVQRLRDVGCQKARFSGAAVGGLMTGLKAGPEVVFSSNDPVAATEVLAALGVPRQGSVLAVFGPGINLEQGDYLIKVDFTDELAKDQVALPTSGPSIDSFELIISRGTSMPAVAVGADLVISLQNQAQTASEFVHVELEHYRSLADGQLAVDLSLRVFDPTFRDRACTALVQSARKRVALYGATLIRSTQSSDPESGRWPLTREALGAEIDVIQEIPPRTPLFFEDFGRPKMPSITLRAGSADQTTIQALARVLSAVLALEPVDIQLSFATLVHFRPQKAMSLLNAVGIRREISLSEGKNLLRVARKAECPQALEKKPSSP